MDIKKIRAFMDRLHNELPPQTLLASTFVSRKDGQCLVTVNGNPMLDAMATNATNFLEEALEASQLGTLGDYYMVDMPGNLSSFVIISKDYWCGIAINKANMTLGMLFNVIIPQTVQQFKDAVQ